MNVQKPVKYATNFLLCLLINIGTSHAETTGTVILSSCGLERYGGAAEHSHAIPSPLPSLKHKIADKERELDAVERQLADGDWSANFKQRIQSDNFAGSGFGWTPNSQSTFELNYPLTFNKTHSNQRLLKLKKELLIITLESLKKEDLVQKLNLLIDLHETINVQNILAARLQVNRRLEDYYKSLRKAGAQDIEEELRVRNAILILNDQLFANSIKRASVLDELGLSTDITLPYLFSNFDPKPLDADCQFVTFEILTSKNRKAVAMEERDQLLLKNNYTIDFSMAFSNSLTSGGNTTDEASAQINLVVPLSDGGKRSTALLSKSKEVVAFDKKILDLKDSLGIATNTQKSKEQVFLLSIKSIKKELEGVSERISELSERNKLGQTVFLERSTLEIEKTRLKESLLRLISDFHQEWYKFHLDKKLIN